MSRVKLPKLILCCGYPASGKTTFSMHLMEHCKDIVRINQDEMGKTDAVNLFCSNIKNTKTILVDTCNLTKQHREEWLKLAFYPKCICLYFNIPFQESMYRIEKRTNHPSIKDNSGKKILESLKDKLIEPKIDEGFEKIISIQNDDDINSFFKSIGLNVPFESKFSNCVIKFPRTKHLFNLGSASRDDLLCSKSEQALFLNRDVYVQEKVDGANLGIFIDNYKIIAQNRSHFVNSLYHPQFKLLDKWILQHADDIMNILGKDDILYGEWLYAKHSINYERLPDYFLAFDIYNKITKKFYTVEYVTEKLSSTAIKQVPLICKKKFTNVDEFKLLIKSKSKFYDGQIEGIYIRICDGDATVNRAKVVRPDFIGGNQHWTKNKITINKLDIY